MKYQDKTFSVAMPSGSAWPFKAPRPSPYLEARCAVCGAFGVPGTAHLNALDDGRPRRRVCFGQKGPGI